MNKKPLSREPKSLLPGMAARRKQFTRLLRREDYPAAIEYFEKHWKESPRLYCRSLFHGWNHLDMKMFSFHFFEDNFLDEFLFTAMEFEEEKVFEFFIERKIVPHFRPSFFASISDLDLEMVILFWKTLPPLFHSKKRKEELIGQYLSNICEIDCALTYPNSGFDFLFRKCCSELEISPADYSQKLFRQWFVNGEINSFVAMELVSRGLVPKTRMGLNPDMSDPQQVGWINFLAELGHDEKPIPLIPTQCSDVVQCLDYQNMLRTWHHQCLNRE